MRKTLLTGGLAVVLGLGALLVGTSVVGGPASGQTPRSASDIDWYNATFRVPAVGPCPSQRVSFTDGRGETADDVYRFTPGADLRYGDVTGEGIQDVLMLMDCGPRNSEYTTALIAMTTDAAGTAPRRLGTVVDPDTWTTRPTDFTIWYGDVATLITEQEPGSEPTSFTAYYRWAQSARAFVRVDNG